MDKYTDKEIMEIMDYWYDRMLNCDRFTSCFYRAQRQYHNFSREYILRLARSLKS